MKEIKWNSGKTQFLGRNGYFGCVGFMLKKVQFEPKDNWPGYIKDVVRVYPVTTKGIAGRCFIEIPLDCIDLFKEALDGEGKPRLKKEGSRSEI